MAYLSKNEITEAIKTLLSYGPASQNSTPIIFLLSYLFAKQKKVNRVNFHKEIVNTFEKLCLIFPAQGDRGVILMEPFNENGITVDRGRVKSQHQVKLIVGSNVFSKTGEPGNYPKKSPYLTKSIASRDAFDFKLASDWELNLKKMLGRALPSLAIFALRPFEINETNGNPNDIINALIQYYGTDLGLKPNDFKDHYDCSSEEVTELKSIDCLIESLNNNELSSDPSLASESVSTDGKQLMMTDDSLQVIFFGAPGTGKSHVVAQETQHKEVIRTTFHPDSDYASFVGSYKPTCKEVPLLFIDQGKAIAVTDVDNKPVTESKIVYEYVAQAFLKVYVAAWTKICDALDNSTAEPQYLVIEEINRGNCAQIFGDIFQLLDRNDYGFSKYPITADQDMQRYLRDALSGLSVSDNNQIDSLYDYQPIINQVLQGEILVLPSNLYIFATMNTSDQSLFPIDSAFKRRWEWIYMPISEGKDNSGNPLGWQIEINNKHYDWWMFIYAINERIGSITSSEDKKLGYFFCKARNNTISANTFANKVIFYLWNEVFKDYGQDNDIFKDDQGNSLSFDRLFEDAGNGYPQLIEPKAEFILTNLGLLAQEDQNNVNP